jgi:membrane-associated phospholipid phosphatase
MSASDGMKQKADARLRLSRLKYVRENAIGYFRLFARKPRRVFTGSTTSLHFGTGALGAAAVIILTMMMLDAPSIGAVAHLPHWLIASFDRLTDFGRSVWFLAPIALVLAGIAVLASPALPVMSQRVLAALAVRLGFLFSAIALPGLVVTIAKRLIGRARPLVGGSADPFLYLPLGWKVEYASFPSGHATDAFAAAMAIGALWPRARPWMWTYAVVIAVSRIVLTAHFPSDTLAGAAVGVAGAVLVRAWFASRGLAFAPGDDGRISPLPGPSFARIKRVARQLIAP